MSTYEILVHVPAKMLYYYEVEAGDREEALRKYSDGERKEIECEVYSVLWEEKHVLEITPDTTQPH